MDDRNADVKLALEEMRLNMQESISAGAAIDNKLILVLTVAGIIFVIAESFQEIFSGVHPTWYLYLLGAALILYILAIGIALFGARPQRYRGAIASQWEELEEHIFGKSEREGISSLLSGYVEQIQHNRKINQSKGLAFQISFIVLMFTVALLFVLVAFS